MPLFQGAQGSNDNAGFLRGGQAVTVTDRPPLYLQHDGHSRTVVGVERRRDRHGGESVVLLLLDPAIDSLRLVSALRSG